MVYILQGNPRELLKSKSASAQNKYYWEELRISRQQARNELERQHDEAPLYSGPLRIYITCYLPFPCTMSHVKKLQSENMYHMLSPTPDDLTRFVFDVARGILYRHESVIAEMHMRKLCSFDMRTEIEIEELHNG